MKRRQLLTTATSALGLAPLLAGTNFARATLSERDVSTITGLDFGGSTWEPSGACRFTFLDPLPAYPATYIWECFPRRQKGFYTTFFWAADGTPGADGFYTDRTYYGAHPYPDPRNKWHAFQGEPPEMQAGEGHVWEIAIDATDIKGPRVDYDRWYVQVLRVKTNYLLRRYHEYYVDTVPSWQPGATKPSVVLPSAADITYETWALDDPPSPGLVWGDAPWVQARGREVFNGIIRGIRIYEEYLSDEDVISEIVSPLSSECGRHSVWYKKMNPTPGNLVCDPLPNGSGPTPVWSTRRRAGLWRASPAEADI